MNKKIKILIIILNLILILFLISSTVFGTLVDQFKNSIDTTETEDLKDTGGKILGIIRVIGSIVSVAILIILGIKFVLGSAEEKAEYKKAMLPYLVGAVLLFGTLNITDMIYRAITGHRDPIDHTDEDWGGQMYTIQCNNRVKIGPVTRACGGGRVTLAIPEDEDYVCGDCGAVLYEAYSESPTSKALIINVAEIGG